MCVNGIRYVYLCVHVVTENTHTQTQHNVARTETTHDGDNWGPDGGHDDVRAKRSTVSSLLTRIVTELAFAMRCVRVSTRRRVFAPQPLTKAPTAPTIISHVGSTKSESTTQRTKYYAGMVIRYLFGRSYRTHCVGLSHPPLGEMVEQRPNGEEVDQLEAGHKAESEQQPEKTAKRGYEELNPLFQIHFSGDLYITSRTQNAQPALRGVFPVQCGYQIVKVYMDEALVLQNNILTATNNTHIRTSPNNMKVIHILTRTSSN